MYRLGVILLMLAASGLLTGSVASLDDSDTAQLAERVRAHINERMYGACKSVVLKRQAEGVYRGQAEFLNGVTVSLEANASGGAIEYRFLPQPEVSAQATERRLIELEMTVARQEAEIARLRGLCLGAGIETDPPRVAPSSAQIEDANGIEAQPIRESQIPVYEEAPEIVVEEAPRFTWRVYERIQKGMSYDEVAAILDDGGDLISGSYFDNAQNEVIVWTNPDDSHICVVFRDGLVLVKTQFGLPESLPEPPR